ncbi:hypothetical protein COCVIDRAFT_88268, partial [Bipolaris victoriae FI3]
RCNICVPEEAPSAADHGGHGGDVTKTLVLLLKYKREGLIKVDAGDLDLIVGSHRGEKPRMFLAARINSRLSLDLASVDDQGKNAGSGSRPSQRSPTHHPHSCSAATK